MTLEDKVALVTGAGQGIGKASALALAEQGADVAAVDIDHEAAKQTCGDIKSTGRRGVAIPADIGSVADIESMIARTVEALGAVDVLVNNAGITRHIQFLEITEEDWDRIHRVNARGAFFCMQRVAGQMLEQSRGGRIINIASVAGQGWSGTSNAAYAASKGAVIAMTRIAAHNLGAHDINVNAICPGVTSTPLVENLLASRSDDLGVPMDELTRGITDNIPTGKISEACDIAAMVVFLAGPGGRNISGQCLNVDGGQIMH